MTRLLIARVRRTAGIVAALVSLSLAASAQTPVGPVVTVAGSGNDPDVAIDNTGQSVVVWNGTDADAWGVFARRLDALGSPAGDAFVVNEGTAGLQWDPAVAMGPDGGFVVLWKSQTASGTHVVFRRFDAAGVPQGGDVQADVDPAQQPFPRSVAIDPTGTILVVWDTRPGLGVSDVLARRFDPAGNPLGAPFRVSSATTGNPGAAAAAGLREGGFIVAWNHGMQQDLSYVVERGQIAARAFDAAGLPRGDEFRVRPEADAPLPYNAQVTAEADGGFLITWAYYSGANGPSRAGRPFDAALAPREAEFQVRAKGGDEYDAIEHVAAGPPGGFVVVGDRYTYVDEYEYINHQVHARRMNAAGNLLETEFIVAPEYPSGGPRVAANAAGDFIVVWMYGGAYQGNIRARRLRWDQTTGRLTGRVVDGATGLPVPAANVRAGAFNGRTDASGAYSILLTAGSYPAAVEILGYESDTVQVTVTVGGVTTQDFVIRGVPVLRVAGTTVEDAGGNANGVADVNECFGLRIGLSNLGAGAATVVSAALTTTTAGVTVQQGASAYPDVPAAATATNVAAFAIKTAATLLPGTTIQLTLTVSTAQGAFMLPVSLTIGDVKRQAFDSSGPLRVGHYQGPRSEMAFPVSGIQGVITRVQVRLHVTRQVRGGTQLYLVGPDGTEVTLSHNPWLSFGLGTDCPAGANDVTFDDRAASSFIAARPPSVFVGEYRPDEALALFAGKSGAAANGIWKIQAADWDDDTTVIQCARVLITYHTARSGECEDVAIAGTVTSAGTNAPVPGASVRTNTGFQTVADADGRYRLAVTPGPHRIEVQAAGHSPGYAEVTAAAGATVNADVALAPLVLAVDAVVVDDTGAGGNGNGRVDFDEAFRLSVTLSNAGTAVGGVPVTLRALSPGVVVSRGVSLYPALPAGGSATNVPPFELRTTSSFQTGQPLSLMLTLAVGHGAAEVPVSLESGTVAGSATFTGVGLVRVSGLTGPIAKVVVQLYAEGLDSSGTTFTLDGPDRTLIELKDLGGGWRYEANLGTSCPADDDDLTFDDAASVGIWSGQWPWRGRFRPIQPLSRFNGKAGLAANGLWQIRAYAPFGYTALTQCSRLLIDTFATAGADAADLIFRDGFDAPEPLAPWSEVANDGGLSATAAAALTPTARGLQAVVDDRAGLFVRHDAPSGEGRYRARFYFDPNGFDPGEAGGKHRAVIFLAFAEAPQKRLVLLVLRRLGGVYSLRGVVRLDDDTLAETPFAEIADAPHLIELDWRKASAPGASDGAFELWIDGVSAGRLDGLDNDLRAVDFIRLGAMTLKDGATGTLFFDQFEARRALPVGPWVP